MHPTGSFPFGQAAKPMSLQFQIENVDLYKPHSFGGVILE